MPKDNLQQEVLKEKSTTVSNGKENTTTSGLVGGIKVISMAQKVVQLGI